MIVGRYTLYLWVIGWIIGALNVFTAVWAWINNEPTISIITLFTSILIIPYFLIVTRDRQY